MKHRVPDYYHKFSCIGSKCKDNCCIGWEIDIDEETFSYYQSVSNDFGEKLKKGISKQPFPHFQMDSHDRCFFLNDQNLCEIFIELGEENLCQICTEHPRFHGRYGTIEESGIGLACEAASELILYQKEAVQFLEKGSGSSENEVMEYLFSVRNEIFRILQNRTISMEKRWNYILLFTECVQDFLNQGTLKEHISIEELDLETSNSLENMKSLEYLNFWISIYQDLEIMDDLWKKLLTEVQVSQINPKNMNLEHVFYEQLMVYFIYRHFMKCVYDDNPLDKVKFAMISCLIIARIIQCLGDSTYYLKDIDIARIYSKEIEYSKANMESIFEELLFDFL